MNLDSAITFLVLTSALFSGFVAVRSRAWRWLAVVGLNLAVLAASWAFLEGQLLWTALPVWLLTMMAPNLAIRLSERLARRESFTAAMWLARVAGILHPSPLTRQRVMLADAQRLEQAGDLEGSRRVLAALAERPGARTLATLLGLRLEQRWDEIRAWCEEDPSRIAFDPVAFSFWLRALGETGRREELVAAYGASAKAPINAPVESQVLLFTAAFGGREQATAEVLAAQHADMPEDARTLWRLTARKLGGADANTELLVLARRARPRVALVARMRIEATATPLSTDSEAILDRLDREVAVMEPSRAPRPLATTILVLLNVYAYVREIPGGTMDLQNLHRLGALDTAEVDGWYRVATAAILHYGFAHLVANLLGLIVLGPSLEALVGRTRTLIVYLVAGIGANVLAVIWSAHVHGPPAQIVGASGAVMGVAGALLARRAIRWHRKRTPMAKRETLSLVLIFVCQLGIDQIMPHVAASVHIFGAILGAVGALMLPVRKRAPSVVERDGGRARIALALVGLLAMGGLELAWHAAKDSYLSTGTCSEADPEACREDCEAMFGSLDAGLLAPKMTGARGQILLRSCARHAERVGPAEAFAIYEATCEAGYMLGCTNAAVMLHNGEGRPANEDAAAVLHRRACDFGLAVSCRYLGEILVNRGPDSLGEARKELGQACDAGDATGCQELRQLERFFEVVPAPVQ